MKELLEKLFLHQFLSEEEAGEALEKITEGAYSEVEVAAFMTVFRMRNITADELKGFRKTLRRLAKPITLEGKDRIDIVGTGGDGKNTFNISTTSSFVVAGAGYKVSKHGNYGSSSISGSSNVLQYLGYEFTSDQSKLQRQLDEANICFLHAPLFHPALKFVAPIRKQLGVKTFFNMMGPLVNPSQPDHHFLGVYSKELSRLYPYVLAEDEGRFNVVYSIDGYDEISLTDDFILNGHDSTAILSAADLGLPALNPKDITAGTSVDNAAAVLMSVLNDRATKAQKAVVLANAGMAIHTICPEKDIQTCIAEAEESIASDRAAKAFYKLIELK